MSTRISSLAALLLAACSSEPNPDQPPGDTIDCAPAGQESFGAECTAQLTQVDGERVVVVRNPDGSFHRLRIVDDGRWLEPADGAGGISVEYAESVLTVEIGGDRYVLPADPAEYGPVDE